MLRPFICLPLAFACTVALAAEPAAAPAASSTADSAPAAPTMIHVGGSDMLQTAIGAPLTSFIRSTHQNAKVDMRGSVPALTGLKKGEIQLAIIAAPVGQPPAPPEFKAIPFCFQVDYVIVNQKNPLTTVNLLQLARVYGSIMQDASYWGDLQLTGDWVSKPIVIWSTSADDGVVLELFKNLILSRQPMKSTVHLASTAEEMINTVASNENTLGLSGFDPGPPNKVLLISSEKGAPSTSPSLPIGTNHGAARPSPENIFSGAYPLRLPFYLVYKPADLPHILPLLRVLLGAEYADHLREQHFVPVPDTERSSSLLELDNSK